MLKDILWVFFISILPIIELRGAIPVGAAKELPFYINYACAVIGNMLPVPFILLFIPKILEFLRRFRIFRPIVDWVYKKAHKNRHKIDKSVKKDGTEVNPDFAEPINEKSESLVIEKRMSPGAFIGLMLFVMIPLPGTGAWTGTLVASLFDFPKKPAFLATLLGVLGSGVIMCLASYGVVGFLSFLNN